MSEYKYGLDDLIKGLSPITAQSEAEAEEVFGYASRLPTLPGTYIVKAVIRCNQFNGFTMQQCDWVIRIEKRAPFIATFAKAHLAAHLRRAHPYLGEARVRQLIAATHFNVRDAGR